MKPLLIPLIMLLSITLCYGGDSLTHQRPYTILRLALGPQPEISRRVTFKVMPAIERRWGQYSVQLQAGMVLPLVAYNIQDTIDNLPLKGYVRWYTVRAEFRKYARTRGKAQLYIGGEVFANYFETPCFDTYYNLDDTVKGAYKDAFVLNKKMFGIGAVAGFQRNVARNVLVGIHAGLGVKFRYTTAPHKLDKDARRDYRHGHVEAVSDKIGWTVTKALPLSISVAYVFR